MTTFFIWFEFYYINFKSTGRFYQICVATLEKLSWTCATSKENWEILSSLFGLLRKPELNMMSFGRSKNTNTWNSIIQLTCGCHAGSDSANNFKPRRKKFKMFGNKCCNSVTLKRVHHMFSRILNLRNLIFFHRICSLFWSILKEF